MSIMGRSLRQRRQLSSFGETYLRRNSLRRGARWLLLLFACATVLPLVVISLATLGGCGTVQPTGVEVLPRAKEPPPVPVQPRKPKPLPPRSTA